MNQNYDYIIYHRGCYDGFSGFFILHQTKTIDKNAIIYPDVPSAKDLPPNLENKNVIIIDVAYKKEILESIIKIAKKVTFIDHHSSIFEDIKSLNIKKPNEIVYNEKMCGATLVWKYFFRNNKNKEKYPLFLKYISDNDRGEWSLKYTKPFMLGLTVNYSTEPTNENLQKWKKLFDKKEITNLIKRGKIYQEYHNYLLDVNYKKYSMLRFPSERIFNDFPNEFERVGQYKVAVYNGGGCPTASSLGEKMMKKINCDFVLMWNYQFDKKEYVIILRSGENVNVGKIAKLFGGGGHDQASAFSFNKAKYEIYDLFLPDVFPRSNK